MYLSAERLISSSMFLQSLLEKIAGSIPDSAQPPTPSATAITFELIEAASSPPFFTF